MGKTLDQYNPEFRTSRVISPNTGPASDEAYRTPVDNGLSQIRGTRNSMEPKESSRRLYHPFYVSVVKEGEDPEVATIQYGVLVHNREDGGPVQVVVPTEFAAKEFGEFISIAVSATPELSQGIYLAWEYDGVEVISAKIVSMPVDEPTEMFIPYGDIPPDETTKVGGMILIATIFSTVVDAVTTYFVSQNLLGNFYWDLSPQVRRHPWEVFCNGSDDLTINGGSILFGPMMTATLVPSVPAITTDPMPAVAYLMISLDTDRNVTSGEILTGEAVPSNSAEYIYFLIATFDDPASKVGTQHLFENVVIYRHGVSDGQILYWVEETNSWEVTDAPTDGSIPYWNDTDKKYVWIPKPLTGSMHVLTIDPALTGVDGYPKWTETENCEETSSAPP